MPEYTLDEFKEWTFKNKQFNDLYAEWVESGFEQDYKPSCDRILDTIGYRLDNLQWVTYAYNRAKPKMAQQKRLVLLNEHKQPIALFYGILNAEKLLGKSADTIRRYVNKKTLNGGYYWVVLD